MSDNVIAFRAPQTARFWSQTELQDMVELYSACARSVHANSWSTGATDHGDPQFYLLAADEECLLCLTRIGRQYVLEDGQGVVLSESASLHAVIADARRMVVRARRIPAFVVRALFVVCTCRAVLDQKIELILAESTEHIARFAPQLGAFV